MSNMIKKIEKNVRKKVIAEYSIKLFADDSVEISGPIDEQFIVLYRHVMNKAERAVLDRIKQQKQSQIIVPELKVKVN